MSLKPLVTHFDAIDSLYAPYTGGGGGGGTSTINVVASTLTVSSILGGGAGQNLDFPNGFTLPAGASIVLAGAPGPTAAGDIDFTNNNGTITGLSSINGAAYPPAGATNLSTPLQTKYITPGGPQPISPVFSTTLGAWYNASLGISDWAFSGTIADGDHLAVLMDTTVLGTIDMVQASTIKGKGQPYGMVMSGPVKAAASGSQFLAYPNAACAVSTFLTLDFAGWVSPLQ